MSDEEKNIVTNRAAFHEYHILEKYEAGIALTGTEVKRFPKLTTGLTAYTRTEGVAGTTSQIVTRSGWAAMARPVGAPPRLTEPPRP